VGLVPEIEERDGAIFNGYTWREWTDLPYADRVYGLAHFRVHRLIQLHNNEAEIKHAERTRAQAAAAPAG
jgi:hypothetical protein